MLIYGIIFPRWRVAADVSLGSWKIFRRFFPSLFRPIIASAGRKCYTAPAIIPLLFLSPSLISFKSSFGHSPRKEQKSCKQKQKRFAVFQGANAEKAGKSASKSDNQTAKWVFETDTKPAAKKYQNHLTKAEECFILWAVIRLTFRSEAYERDH